MVVTYISNDFILHLQWFYKNFVISETLLQWFGYGIGIYLIPQDLCIDFAMDFAMTFQDHMVWASCFLSAFYCKVVSKQLQNSCKFCFLF